MLHPTSSALAPWALPDLVRMRMPSLHPGAWSRTARPCVASASEEAGPKRSKRAPKADAPAKAEREGGNGKATGKATGKAAGKATGKATAVAPAPAQIAALPDDDEGEAEQFLAEYLNSVVKVRQRCPLEYRKAPQLLAAVRCAAPPPLAPLSCLKLQPPPNGSAVAWPPPRRAAGPACLQVLCTHTEPNFSLPW